MYKLLTPIPIQNTHLSLESSHSLHPKDLGARAFLKLKYDEDILNQATLGANIYII